MSYINRGYKKLMFFTVCKTNRTVLNNKVKICPVLKSPPACQLSISKIEMSFNILMIFNVEYLYASLNLKKNGGNFTVSSKTR